VIQFVKLLKLNTNQLAFLVREESFRHLGERLTIVTINH